jgi:hypothetical protein
MVVRPQSRRAFLRALPLPVLGTLLASCGGAGASDPATPAAPKFAPDGLPGRIVLRLRPGPAGLVAATDDSAWRRTPNGWVTLNLAGLHVQDFTALSASHFIASVRPPGVVGAGPARLVESLDGGATWHDIAHDFGGITTPEFIQALQYDAAAGRLLAVGAEALAASHDHGRHWSLLAGQWHGFASGKDALAVHPVTGDAWYGGQDAIETLVLNRRRAAGGVDTWRALLPTPSTVKGIRFALGEPARVLVSGEGGIVQTRNDGASWETLLHQPDYRFHFDVLQDPARPARLVSASWKKDYTAPQPLIVVISEDHGATWKAFEHPDRQLFGGTWSMAVQPDALGRSVFHLGLYKGGVMRMTLE